MIHQIANTMADSLDEKDKEIEKLNRQIEKLKEWIEYNTGVEIDIDRLMEEKEEKVMTPSEFGLNALEQHVQGIERYANVFDYGKREERKMAESL